MGQSANDVAEKDAQSMLRKEECARGMGHTAMQMMNLLHLDLNSIRLLQLNPTLMSVLLFLPSEDEVEKVFPERCPYSVKKYTKLNT